MEYFYTVVLILALEETVLALRLVCDRNKAAGG